jgi:hypothetical protein
MRAGGAAGASSRRAPFLLARAAGSGMSWTVSCRARFNAALHGRHSRVACEVAFPQIVQFIAARPGPMPMS